MEIANLQQFTGINSAPEQNDELSKETFLQLLSTQLQNQDPLEPASDVEFIQQMATFATLEQQRITNANLNILQLYESSINNSNALNIVGKDVKIQDTSIKHTEGQEHRFFYESDSEAAKVIITVTDDEGRTVFTSEQIGAADGEQEFTWNGMDQDGEPVGDGEYTIKVELEDGEGNAFVSPVYQMHRVRGVSYENGSIMVMVGDRKIPIENVTEVLEPTTASDGGGPGFKNQTAQTQTVHPFYKGPLDQQFQTIRPFEVIAGGR
jgi:flagellar basal-body rod modification protein FlgD